MGGCTGPLERRDGAGDKCGRIRCDARVELEGHDEQVAESGNNCAALYGARDPSQPVFWEAIGAPQEGDAQRAQHDGRDEGGACSPQALLSRRRRPKQPDVWDDQG